MLRMLLYNDYIVNNRCASIIDYLRYMLYKLYVPSLVNSNDLPVDQPTWLATDLKISMCIIIEVSF